MTGPPPGLRPRRSAVPPLIALAGLRLAELLAAVASAALPDPSK